MVKLVNSLIEQGVPKDVIINYTSDCADPVECREKIQAGIDSGYFDQYISGSTATTPEPETPAETKPEHTHNYIANLTKDPTCTEEGCKEVRCTVCGEVISTEVIPVAEHIKDEGTVTKEAGLFTDGTSEIHCTECGKLLETVTIPAKISMSVAVVVIVVVIVIAVAIVLLAKKRKK